jgi:hypothetical protein
MKDEVVTFRKIYSADRLCIERCRFLHIASREKSGGAIHSSGSLRLFNCLFEGCSAKSGGAVASTSSLTLDFITFRKCDAHNGGAIDIRTNVSADCDLTLCAFDSDSATYFGSVYRLSAGAFRVAATNFTRSHGRECVGCLEAKHGPFEMRFCVVRDSSASAHNGAFCTRSCDTFLLELSVFANCSHISSEGDAAATLLIYENPYDSTLCKCAFVGNSPNGSHTVTVANGNSLIISECCFSGAEWKEINQKNVVIELCIFDQQNCSLPPPNSLFGTRAAGYDERLESLPFRVQKRTKGSDGRMFQGKLMIVAFSAAVGIALVLTAIQTALRHYRRGVKKQPRAFQ